MSKKELKPQSSEEQFITNFLETNNIKFIEEFIIKELNGDTKKYRRADFYLPRLKIYVEYFGQYNSTKEKRQEYDLKAQVYIKNGLPTVFIYPHELGFLAYAFHTKVVRLLKLEKFNLKKQLYRYRLNRYLENFRSGSFKTLIISIGIFMILDSYDTGLSDDLDTLLVLTALLLFFFSLLEMLRDIWRYFVKDI